MLVFNYEIFIGLFSVVLGLAAVIITFLAKQRLSNSSLLTYLNYSLAVISSLTLFSLFHTVREMFALKSVYGSIVEVPEYFFVSIAYISIFAGALSMFKLSEVYGFKIEGIKINNSKKKRK